MNLRTELESFAATLEAAWLAAPAEQRPSLAADALKSALLHERATLDALLGMLCEAQPLPRQLDPLGAFGDPPFTLYFGKILALDIYFWHQPEVAIHNHSFDGAFTVLEGCSLHTHFAFKPEQQWGGLQVGALTASKVELLKKGDIRPITAGTAFIHQVAHLSSPCVSLVVRTLPSAGDPPIYDFFKPGCALLQQRHLTEHQLKRLALAGLLHRLERTSELKALLDASEDVIVAWVLRLAAVRTQDLNVAKVLSERLTPRSWFEAFLQNVLQTDRALFNWQTLKIEAHRLLVLLMHEVKDPETQKAILDAYDPGSTLTLSQRLQKWAATNGCEDLFGVPLPYESAVVLGALIEGQDDHEAAMRVAVFQGLADPAPFAAFVAQMKAMFLSHPWIGPLIQRL